MRSIKKRPFVAAILTAATMCSMTLVAPQRAPAQTVSPPPTLAYPPAPTSTATDTYFGTRVRDPYRPLESIDAPQTKAWIARENALTRSYLDAIPARPAIAAAFRKLYNYPKMSAPFRVGAHYFSEYNSGLQTQNVTYIRSVGGGPARVFFDPNTLAKDGSIQVSATSYARDGSYLAYSTSQGGEDWQTWHIKRVANGRDLPDVLHWSKFSDAAWDGDRGFYYSGYDAPTAANKTLSVLGVEKVWFHRLGTPQSADRLVFASTAHPERFVGAQVTDDDRFVVLSSGTLGTTSLAWKRRGAPDSAFRQLTAYTPNVDYTVVGNDGAHIYL